MLKKMLRNDIGRNKAINILLCLFVTVASMLVAGAFYIISEMLGSMDAFFEDAVPPHYMQMVTDVADQSAIDSFSAAHPLVLSQQTLEMLGIDNSFIYYGANPEPYAGSVMENSFVTQSPSFDYLLDLNNLPAAVGPGEIAAPIYAIDAYGLKVGDDIIIRDGHFEAKFVVSGFIRDAQMNASLVSSKRFLVHEDDYNRLKEHTGEVEYMVEFLLADPSKTIEFETDYLAAGLPSGIAITLPIIRLMNAMTGGLPAVVLIFTGAMLILIAAMCLRFTIVATLEEEYREIGVMKAIGLAPRYIGKLYKSKYNMLSGVACAAGFFMSLLFGALFAQSISLYMGSAAASIWSAALPLIGAASVYAIVAGQCSLVLRKLRNVSAVEAIRGGAATGVAGRAARVTERTAGVAGRAARSEAGGLRRILSVRRGLIPNINIALGARDVIVRLRHYITPIMVFMLCTFLIIVPANFLNTINKPGFSGYMGIGQCDALITLRYSQNIDERYAAALESLAADGDVKAYSGRVTASYKTPNSDGAYTNINIQNGDFTVFPVPYIQGSAPSSDSEIALSLLNAREYEKSPGDIMEVIVGGEPLSLVVSGIYQDLTNGGRTAQAHLAYRPENVLWYAVLLDFADGADAAQKREQYSAMFSPAKVNGIADYIQESFASTIKQLETVTLAVSIISAAVAAFITALFLKMIFARDRRQITIMKGLGFSSAHIRTQYISAAALSLLAGLALGTIAAGTLGEMLIGALMSGMGASSIPFVVDPAISYVACPAMLAAAVLAAVLLSSRAIGRCGNYIISE
ncbi:MAG: ABC transporter permease [Oscillospiraceae bacterium]|nr:ABC transporter permease [Oscillospiraceae bacterium]